MPKRTEHGADHSPSTSSVAQSAWTSPPPLLYARPDEELVTCSTLPLSSRKTIRLCSRVGTLSEYVTSQWKTNQSCKTTIWHHRKGKWVQRCHKISAFSLTYILGAKSLEIAPAACRGGGGDLPSAFEHIRHETGTYFYVTAPQVVGSNPKQ